MERDLYDKLKEKIIHNKYPPQASKEEKRELRRLSKKYTIKDGKLYINSKQLICSDEKILILQGLHSDPTSGGHLGRDKTRAKITEKYYWPRMIETIDDYVTNCIQCQSINAKPISAAVPLNPVPVPPRMWELIGIHIVGPLPETISGNKYITGATTFQKGSKPHLLRINQQTQSGYFYTTLFAGWGFLNTSSQIRGGNSSRNSMTTSANNFELLIESVQHTIHNPMASERGTIELFKNRCANTWTTNAATGTRSYQVYFPNLIRITLYLVKSYS